MKGKKNRKKLPEHEVGSENVFQDLGFENAKDELIKADLILEIAKIIRKKHLTQAQAAKMMDVDQPRVSSLLRGNLDLFSIEMLMHFLNALGQDIEIVVKPKPRSRSHGHLAVSTPSSCHRSSLPIAARGR